MRIDIESQDVHEMSTLITMISGYLNKKNIKFSCWGWTEMEDGRQVTEVTGSELK